MCVMAQLYKPSIAGGLEVQVHLWLHREFKASLGQPCVTHKKEGYILDSLLSFPSPSMWALWKVSCPYHCLWGLLMVVQAESSHEEQQD